MKYRQVNISDAKIIVELHKKNITGGFLSSLDSKILEKIYSSILSEEQNFGFMSVEKNIPVGFVLITENCNILYKKFLKNNLNFGIKILFSKIFSLAIVKKMLDHIVYPEKRKQFPKAELLSIAVNKKYRKSGVAKKLVSLAIKELESKKIKSFIAVVGQKLVVSNNFMQSIGGKKLTEIKIHRGEKSNVYLWKL